MDQKLVNTNICFSHFSDKCFSHFPIPKSVFGASWEETGTNQRYFPFFSYTFFSIFPHPQIQISGDLGKKWDWAPSSSFRIHFFIFSYLLIQILKRFGKRWSWTPTEPAAYPFVTACVIGHRIRQWDLLELGSGSKRYVTNICCSKMLDHSNRHAH